MNRFAVIPARFPDLSVIMRQARTLTIRCAGQEFTDLIVTESAGEVVIECNAPTPWQEQVVVMPEAPKRRGRPPKAKLEGDSTA